MTLSPIAEDYLTAIYYLQTEHERAVGTAEISEDLGVTPPSVTSMLETLDEQGFVEYTPYEGVELSAEGESVVLRLVRNHRLLETFLVECLDYPWSEVHDEADRLEHHVSDEFVSRLEAFLGEPTTDPHGDPIPDSSLSIPTEGPFAPLTEYGPGETVVVEQVPHRDPDVREYLTRQGIGPGTRLSVEDAPPIDLVTVFPASGDASVPLPTHVARRLGVRAADGTSN
ncbi:metal-dependent transcriptional regulator [Halopiger goleimassiliensis]|uniref:metal-dependent transcriptional regulator n=1 Tax=Halopiger goleimassiliensis TaxID=1293048 RepID=UPI000677DB23|nr:metal-dependent transcriptional regulator [Halopiger goleimassiliensis]